MKKHTLIASFSGALAGLLLTAFSALAQAPSTGGPTPGAAAVPLDGGASLLVASGVAFGLKKLRDSRKAR